MDSGYSGTPQVKKLGITAGCRLSLVGAPAGWALEAPVPETIAVREGPADVIVAFARSAAEVKQLIPELGERIRPAGALWIAWPRKAAGHVSDVTENLLRDVALPLGLVDVKVAAIDTDWSGLKIVWRKELR